jgi:hypothetical protein
LLIYACYFLHLDPNRQVCSKDVDGAWGDLTDAIADFEQKDYAGGVEKLGAVMADLAHAVSGCGVTDLAKVLEEVATQLGDAPLATAIGDAVQVLVSGSDITLFLQKMEHDFKSNSWPEFGHDLGDLAVSALGCNVCCVSVR